MQYTIAPVIFFAAFTATAGAAAHLYLHGADGQITGKVATALGADGQPISGTGDVDNGADDVGLALGDMVYGVSFDGISFDSATSFAAGLIDLPGMAEMASDPNSPFGELTPAGRRKGSKDRGFGTRGPGGGDEGPPRKKPKTAEEKKREKEANEAAAVAAADEICKSFVTYKKGMRGSWQVGNDIVSALHPLLSSPLAVAGEVIDRCQTANTTAAVVSTDRNEPFFIGTNASGFNGRQSRAIALAKKQCKINIRAAPGTTPIGRGQSLACRAAASDCTATPFQSGEKNETNKHHAEMRAIAAYCKDNQNNPKLKDKKLCEAIDSISCDKPACSRCAAVLTAWGVAQKDYLVTKEVKCVFNPVPPDLHLQPREDMTVAQCAAATQWDPDDEDEDEDEPPVQGDEYGDDGGGKPPAK